MEHRAGNDEHTICAHKPNSPGRSDLAANKLLVQIQPKNQMPESATDDAAMISEPSK